MYLTTAQVLEPVPVNYGRVIFGMLPRKMLNVDDVGEIVDGLGTMVAEGQVPGVPFPTITVIVELSI